MTHPLKTVAVSTVLSIVLLSSAANAALNTNAGNTPTAKPAYAGQQFAAKMKTDRDGARGRQENEGKSHRGSDNDGEGNEGNEGGHGGNDSDGGSDGGNDGGSDGEGGGDSD